MVKLGDDYFNEDRSQKSKKEKKKKHWLREFGDFAEDYWWVLLIGGWLLFGGIESLIKASKPDAPKETAVVVEVVEDGIDDYKVKYLRDGAVQVVDLGDDSYVVGDTVLAER